VLAEYPKAKIVVPNASPAEGLARLALKALHSQPTW